MIYRYRNLPRLALWMIVASMVTAIASAQPMPTVIEVDVPFAFVANTRLLPAGSYEIRPADNDQNVWKIENVDGDETVMAATIVNRTDDEAAVTEVVFQQTEDGYVLSRLVIAKSRTEYQLADTATYGAKSEALVAIRPAG